MALTQSHYRFGTADGTESTHGWLAAEDRPVMLPPGRAFLARMCVQADATGLNNVVMQWQYRLNGGAWTNITTSSAVVRTGATAVFGATAHCTKRLSGTGTFESSANGCTHTGTAGGNNNDIVANGNSETLIGLQIVNADTAIGDVIELRVTRGGSTLLDAYAVLPTITVGAEILAVQSRAAEVHTSLTAGSGRVTDSVTTVRAVGLSASDLADASLSIEMNVWGTTVQGSTDPADFTTHLYGPDVWAGGQVGTKPGEFFGMAVPPGFSWQADLTADIRKVLATFQPSHTVTFGADATIVPQTGG
jgi:hypothetical protein